MALNRRCAATLYIVRCAPILLAPLGVLTALLHLLLGILLTIASAGALVVWPLLPRIGLACDPG